jgi:type VI secretion system protein ImpA
MASSPLLDFDALVAPIPGESPAGAPLPYDVRLKLEDLRKEINPDDYDADDPRRPQAYRAPDWAGIIEVATTTLTKTSKDLLAAARLCEALTIEHRFAGLRDGLELLRRLAVECWDRVHPIIEEGESLEAREGPFKWLNQEKYGSQFPHTLRITALLVVGGKGFSFEDWQSKDRRAGFDAAAGSLSQEAAQELVDHLKAAKASLQGLSETLNEKMGDLAPDFVSSENTEHLGAAINDCLKVANQILQRKSGAPASDDGTSAGAGGAPSAGGSTVALNLASRADAYRMLNEAADLLQRLEPHSPIPYLVKRAVHLGEMKFPELMKALIRENATLDELYRLVGIEPPPASE